MFFTVVVLSSVTNLSVTSSSNYIEVNREIFKLFLFSRRQDYGSTPGDWTMTCMYLLMSTMILFIEFNDRKEMLLPKSIFARKLVENYTDFIHRERLMRYKLCAILIRFHAAVWAKTWENENSETPRNLRKQYWPHHTQQSIWNWNCSNIWAKDL
jgi:hypothetical protein